MEILFLIVPLALAVGMVMLVARHNVIDERDRQKREAVARLKERFGDDWPAMVARAAEVITYEIAPAMMRLAEASLEALGAFAKFVTAMQIPIPPTFDDIIAGDETDQTTGPPRHARRK